MAKSEEGRIFYRIVREGFSGKVTSKQRPEEHRGANQVAIWGNRF